MARKNETTLHNRRPRRDNSNQGIEDLRARGDGTGRWIYGNPVTDRNGNPIMVTAQRGRNAGQLIPKREKLSYQRWAYASDGKKVYGTAKTQRASETALRQNLAAYEEQLRLAKCAADAPTTFAAFADWVVELRLDQRAICDTTAVTYRDRIKRIIDFKVGTTTFGKLNLSDISAVHLESLSAYLVKGTKRNGARGILSVLRTILQHAVNLDILPKMPKGIVMPKKVYKRSAPPTSEDFRTVFQTAHAAGDTSVVAAMTLLWHGLRLGEACAVTTDRIDGNTITVDRQLRRYAKHGTVAFAVPKTARGYRQLVLSDDAMRMIYGNIEVGKTVQVHTIEDNELTTETVGAHFVVTCANGNAPHPQHIAQRIRNYAKRAGISGFHVHDLRSTVLVDLTDAGLPISAVASVLGHSTAIALENYMRIRPAKQTEVTIARSDQLTTMLTSSA